MLVKKQTWNRTNKISNSFIYITTQISWKTIFPYRLIESGAEVENITKA